MPKRVLLGVVAGGLAVLVAVAFLHRTPLAFTLGVPRSFPAVAVAPGQTACQQPIEVPGAAEFDRLTVPVGTYRHAGAPLAATILDAGGRVVARGRLAGGYPDIGARPLERIRLDRTVRTGPIAACVHNAGSRPVALYGSSALGARGSTAVRDGRALPLDIAFSFERPSHSLADLVKPITQRAALFRFSWLRGWVYVALGVLLVIAGPWLLVRALRGALPAD